MENKFPGTVSRGERLIVAHTEIHFFTPAVEATAKTWGEFATKAQRSFKVGEEYRITIDGTGFLDVVISGFRDTDKVVFDVRSGEYTKPAGLLSGQRKAHGYSTTARPVRARRQIRK